MSRLFVGCKSEAHCTALQMIGAIRLTPIAPYASGVSA